VPGRGTNGISGQIPPTDKALLLVLVENFILARKALPFVQRKDKIIALTIILLNIYPNLWEP
jgi:hypothetical protein